jgi:hypothetical protein
MHLPPAPETAALLAGDELTRLVGDVAGSVTAEIKRQLEELLKNPSQFQAPPSNQTPAPQPPTFTEADYWYSLINTKAAADFLGLSPRRLEGLRYIGGGPPFRVISPRCVRYTRLGCAAWSEERSRANTSA